MAAPMQKITPRAIGEGVEILTSFFAVPGLGLLPINAFLLRAAQPVLIDTGYFAAGGAYLDAIRAAIDPRDLRWIYLTHVDPDHIGALRDVLAEAPNAKLVTTFLGLGKLSLYGAIPPERVHLLNPGQRLDVGDRSLVALKPPTFDAPETTAFVDSKTRVLFSSDCFGAVLSAPAERASDIPSSALAEGVTLWATIDSPWLASIDPAALDANLARVRALDPPIVLSSHLPPAFGMIEVLLERIRAARTATPFVGPDQQAFAKMLAEAAPSPRPAEQPRA